MSDGENSCHLPFIKDGTTYDGCTTDQYHDVGMKKKTSMLLSLL